MPAVQEKVKELTGKEPAPGRQPGRGRRGRRRDPGRRARRRRQGRAAARRHPADARHRDQGRRDDEADRAQHDDPDSKRSEIFSTADDNQPSVEIHVLQGEREMAARQQAPGQVPAHRDPAGAARHAADRGHLRHRRERHPQRLRQGPRHRQGAEDRDQGRLRPLRRRGRADGQRRRVARRRGPQGSASWPRPATSPRTPPTRPRSSSSELGDQVDEAAKTEISAAIKELQGGARVDDAEEIKAKTDAAPGRLPQGLRADLRRPRRRSRRAGGGAPAPRNGACAATTRRRSSTPRSSTTTAP